VLAAWWLAGCGATESLPPEPSAWSSSGRLLLRDAAGAEQRRGSLVHGAESRFGVWLPSGRALESRVRVPAGGVLVFSAEPVDRAAGAPARLVVELRDASGGWQALGEPAEPSGLERRRVDLTAWAGREVSLRFRSAGAGELFLGEPAVFAPSATPRRVVLLFVDTLRPDHLGFLGYDRDTSPRLDALAERSAVFEVARAPSPWTLPSTRAALSGRQPEAWSGAPHLGELLAGQGFVTVGTTSNAFLDAAFGMERGWSEYQTHSKALAAHVVDRALAQLERHRDRDLLMLVHFMDPHLPYREPEAYRGLFDRSEPGRRGETLHREDLLALDPQAPDFAAERQRVVDRYDQTIRYLDDELDRLLAALGPETTVVLFSDHGEEFWEHGGAEHGHTLFEEVLRVPLLVRDPALPPGRHRAPASLLDIAPTLLELLGMPAPPSDGVSLVAVARGRTGAAERLAARPEAFGRMFYGGERWSLRSGDRKWSTWAGRQVLVDLAADPGEQQDLSRDAGDALASYPGRLGAALGSEVHGVWRVLLGLPPTDRETVVRISHPGGFADAWPHPDPLGRRSGSTLRREPEEIVLVQPPGATAPPTLTLLPREDAADPRGLTIEIQSGGRRLAGRVEERPPPFAGGPAPPLLRLRDGLHGAMVLAALSPRPASEGATPLDPEVRDALRELGYID